MQSSAPVLIVGPVVGVAIGLLQAVTRIRAQTLAYARKIVAIFIALLIFRSRMAARLTSRH